MNFIAVAFAGGLGCVLRYSIAIAMAGRTLNFPLATLLVNTLGSFLIGVAFVVIQQKFSDSSFLKALIIVGLLGGFTTFSAFSLETLHLMQNDQFIKAMMNIILSVTTCLICAWMGLKFGRIITGGMQFTM